MNGAFKRWLDLGWNLSNNRDLQCPSCGKHTIDYQYVGDPETRIGYLDIWCTSCLHGIHVSRVKVPGETPMLSFKTDPSTIAARIPKFTWVVPED
jgi:hypothetical protein